MKKIMLLCLLTLFFIVPSYAQTDNPPIITPQNAPSVIQLAQFGDGHVDILSDLIYAPSADTFALSTSLGVWVYDATNPTAEPFLLDGHIQPVYEIAYSPDGQFLASAAFDNVVRIWHLPTRSIIQTFAGEWFLDNIYFSPDGQSVIILNQRVSDSLKIYRASIETGQVQAYDLGDMAIHTLALHPSDNMVAIFFEDPTWELSLWDLGGDSPQHVTTFPLPPDNIEKWQIAFSADGSRLIGAGQNGTIAIWDVATAERMTSYRGHEPISESPIAKIIPSPDGDSFLTFNAIGAGARATAIGIKQWSLAGDLRDTFEVERDWDKVDAVYTADTIQVIAVNSFYNRVNGWDWSTGEETSYHAKNWGDITDMALSPDGETLAITNHQSVRFLSADTLTQIWSIYPPDFASAVAYAPDGRTIATLGRYYVSVWDVQTGELLQQMEAHSLDQAISYSPDGQFIVLEGAWESIRLWDAQTATLAHTIPTDERAYNLTSVPDGRWMMTYLGGRVTFSWNPNKPNDLIQTSSHDATMYDMLWHPTSESLISTFADDTIRAWHPASDTTRTLLDFADDDRFDTLFELAYHPTLDIWAGSNPNYHIILFNLQNPDVAWLQSLTGHRSTIGDIIFSPDGSRLYSAASDGTVRMWGVPNS